MAERMMIDCGRAGKQSGCTLALAGTRDEVMRAAQLHGAQKHGIVDSQELREMVESNLENESSRGQGQDLRVIDCRRFESDINCSLKITGREDEVVDMAVAHAIDAHGARPGPELRRQIRALAQRAEGEAAQPPA
jgi:predicted small metal-binding protein